MPPKPNQVGPKSAAKSKAGASAKSRKVLAGSNSSDVGGGGVGPANGKLQPLNVNNDPKIKKIAGEDSGGREKEKCNKIEIGLLFPPWVGLRLRDILLTGLKLTFSAVFS